MNPTNNKKMRLHVKSIELSGDTAHLLGSAVVHAPATPLGGRNLLGGEALHASVKKSVKKGTRLSTLRNSLVATMRKAGGRESGQGTLSESNSLDMKEAGFEIIMASSWKEVFSLTQLEPTATHRAEWAGATVGSQLCRRANICTKGRGDGGVAGREGGREEGNAHQRVREAPLLVCWGLVPPHNPRFHTARAQRGGPRKLQLQQDIRQRRSNHPFCPHPALSSPPPHTPTHSPSFTV